MSDTLPSLATLVGLATVFLTLYRFGFLRTKSGPIYCRWRDFGATQTGVSDNLVQAVKRVHARGGRLMFILINILVLVLCLNFGRSIVRASWSADEYVGRALGSFAVGAIAVACSFAIAWLAEYAAIRYSLAKSRQNKSVGA
jgi:uncharacterized membrane protein YcjF (UPF0283 family)